MLFSWLRPAILAVEGGNTDTETFESAYFDKYEKQLEANAKELSWPAEDLATAFGRYQILGENLARLGMSHAQLATFLADDALQDRLARKLFYKMLGRLVERRGLSWPRYLFSMWNAGVNYNEEYAQRITNALRGV